MRAGSSSKPFDRSTDLSATSDMRFYETKVPPVVWGLVAAIVVWGVDQAGVDSLLEANFFRFVGLALAVVGVVYAAVAVAGFALSLIHISEPTRPY